MSRRGGRSRVLRFAVTGALLGGGTAVGSACTETPRSNPAPVPDTPKPDLREDVRVEPVEPPPEPDDGPHVVVVNEGPEPEPEPEPEPPPEPPLRPYNVNTNYQRDLGKEIVPVPKEPEPEPKPMLKVNPGPAK